MSNVLAVTPVLRTPEGRARLFGKAFASIYWQRWSGGRVDHFMPSGGDDYSRPNETVTAKYQLAQDVFLAGDYEYMACLEYDMICPEDALQRLVALDADIAYGLYALRHPGHIHWNAANRVEFVGAAWLSNDPDNARAAWGHVAKVQGCGLGCTVIKRRVLETLRFRNWRGVSNDWALACDAREAGFTQVLDLRVICGHMTLTPSPRVLWPDIDAEGFVRTEFLG